MSHRKPVILVTGCSSGIGLALIQQLNRRLGDYRVVATARTSSLSKIAEAGISPTVVEEDDGVIVNAHDESDYHAAYFHLDDGIDGDAADAVRQRAQATRALLPQGIQRHSEAWGEELAKLRWSKRITDEQKRCACSL